MTGLGGAFFGGAAFGSVQPTRPGSRGFGGGFFGGGAFGSGQQQIFPPRRVVDAGYIVDITRDFAYAVTGAAHHTFTATLDRLAGGSWQAAWPVSHGGAREMLEAVAAGEDTYRWGVTVRPVGSDATAFSGFVKTLVLVEGSSSGSSSDAIVAYGASDTEILNHGISYPDPAVDLPSTVAHRWPVYADGPWASAEDAIVELLRDNLGPRAVARRRHPNLVLPMSLGRGGPVVYVPRLPTVLEAVKELCDASGLVVRVGRQSGRVVVTIDEQRSRPDVRWSRSSGTLAGVALTWSGARATSVVVGGEGTGANRLFRRTDATPPPGGFAWPREVFVDASSADTAVELLAEGEKGLRDRTASVGAVINPSTASLFRLGADFELDDLTFVDAGFRPGGQSGTATARVESVTLAHTDSGWTATPTLGPLLGDPVAVQQRIFAELRRRGRA